MIDALSVQNPFRMGYDSVNAMVKKLRTGAQPQSEDTGVTIVTRKNVDDPKVKAVLGPSCANPPS